MLNEPDQANGNHKTGRESTVNTTSSWASLDLVGSLRSSVLYGSGSGLKSKWGLKMFKV